MRNRDIFQTSSIISSSSINMQYTLVAPLSKKRGFIVFQNSALSLKFSCFTLLNYFSFVLRIKDTHIFLLSVDKSIFRRSMFQKFIFQFCAIHYSLSNLFIVKEIVICPYIFRLFRSTLIKCSYKNILISLQSWRFSIYLYFRKFIK